MGKLTSTTLMVAGLAVLVVALLDASTITMIPAGPQGLPGIGRLSLIAIASTLGIVALLSLMLVADTRWSGLAMRGLGAPAFLLIAATFTVSVYSGAAISIADMLGDPSGSDPNQALIVYPRAYDWTAISLMAILLLTVLVAATGYAWLWFLKPVSEADITGSPRTTPDPAPHQIVRGYRSLRLAINRSYDPEPATPRTIRSLSPGHRKWLTRIAQALTVSRAADSSGALLGVMAVGVVAAALGGFIIRWATSGEFLGQLPVLPAGWWSWSYTLATRALSLLPIAAVLYMRRALRDPVAGRKIGIIWDISTFWPRWYHPFAPPSYAERAVPELEMRVRQLTEPPHSQGVVLSGHSQGSVLAIAVLLRLDDRHLQRTALVTHGSPLTRLYARFFPAYFGVPLFTNVALRLQNGTGTRWRNLFRDTDPIGGAIHFDETMSLGTDINKRLLDPRGSHDALGESWPPVMTHFEYDKDTEYLDAVRYSRRALPS